MHRDCVVQTVRASHSGLGYSHDFRWPLHVQQCQRRCRQGREETKEDGSSKRHDSANYESRLTDDVGHGITPIRNDLRTYQRNGFWDCVWTHLGTINIWGRPPSSLLAPTTSASSSIVPHPDFQRYAIKKKYTTSRAVPFTSIVPRFPYFPDVSSPPGTTYLRFARRTHTGPMIPRYVHA